MIHTLEKMKALIPQIALSYQEGAKPVTEIKADFLVVMEEVADAFERNPDVKWNHMWIWAMMNEILMVLNDTIEHDLVLPSNIMSQSLASIHETLVGLRRIWN